MSALEKEKVEEIIKAFEDLLASYKMIANKRILTNNEFVENAEKAIEKLKQLTKNNMEELSQMVNLLV